MSEASYKPLKQKGFTAGSKVRLPVGEVQSRNPGSDAKEDSSREKGVWTFGVFQLDEVQRELRGGQKPLTPDTKPWFLLLELLRARDGRKSKEALIDALWSGPDEGSLDALKQHVMTLRNVLGDGQHTIIVSTPGGGYKIGVRVEFEEFVEPQKFQPFEGMPLPGKPGWTVGVPLGQTKKSWVWEIGEKGINLRVVRFAERQQRQTMIRREYQVSKFLAAEAPAKSCFARVLGEYRDQDCHYIEIELAGEGLESWAAARQREGGLSQELAVNIMIQVCDAVAALHQLGFAHNDLRPDNILVAPTGVTDDWHVKLTGFGNAIKVDPEEHPFGTTKYSPRNTRYRPPEIANGLPGTKSSDVYALGILLFQLLRGDFSVSPTGSWQSLISGKVLQTEIGAAVAQDPRSRLKKASELASRLRSAESRQLKADLETSRRRVLMISLTAGVLLSILALVLFLVWQARERERDAASINTFLTEDLLRESNPAYGKGVSETLHEAIERIRPRIEARFSGRPRIAARVHEEIAEALANESDVDGSGAEFAAAADDWSKANDPEAAIFAQLEHALLELKTQRAGSLDAAKLLLSQQIPSISKLHHLSSRVTFARLDVEGIIALLGGDLSTAKQKFQQAADVAGTDPSISLEMRLSEQARLCYIQSHTGEADQASACFTSLIPRYKAMYGNDSGPVLNLRVNLAQAFMLDKQFAPALKEANDIYPKVALDLGPMNQVTQSVLAVRAQSEEGLGKTDDAIKDMIAIFETANGADPSGFLAVTALTDAAKLECGINRLRSGEEHARQALAAALSDSHNRGLLGQAQYGVAYCILATPPGVGISASRLAEAEQLLDSIDALSASAIAGEPGWGANVDLAKAQLAFAMKNYCEAAKYLAIAKPSFLLPGSDDVQRKMVEMLDRELQSRKC